MEQTEIRRENAIYEKQISLFQEQIYVKETAMLNDKMVRDKFYHQLSFIKELVYQRELSQLNEFIDGIMQNKKIEKDGPANSGNVLLDYIVNNKCEIAVKQGIECTVKMEVPYKFPFSDGDIFIILGNALDNAIEGALKCVSRRYIHIKIIYRKENLFIKISNSFDGKVKKDRHGHLISMKSDLTRYGLGLALIEKSVNKYNGLLNFDIDEENFTLTVLLYS
ncbi:MAG: ATP-binding protein [Clostridia bacterium]